MFDLKKSLCAFIAVLALCGVEARGETFVINNVQGAVFVSTSVDGGPPTLRLGPVFNLSGPGLSIVTQPIPSGEPGTVEARDTCLVNACTPGMVIGTNSSFTGLLSSPFFTHAKVNGVTYDTVRVTGSLNFVSSPIVLPQFGSSLVVTIPFTFSGELTGDAFHPNVVNPVVTATLSGQGLATFHFSFPPGSDASNVRYRLDFIEYRFEPFPVLIDIKPATIPNTINPKSKGRIPVAILTTPSFDAAAVDSATVRFGVTGVEVAAVHSAMEDVDGDGDIDMVLHFLNQDTGIACGKAYASLTGALFTGVKIKGSDSIVTLACN